MNDWTEMKEIEYWNNIEYVERLDFETAFEWFTFADELHLE